MIAARLRRARAALSWEETHDARFVRAVCGKDAQPGVQGDYAVMHDARPSLFYLCGLVCGLAVLRYDTIVGI